MALTIKAGLPRANARPLAFVDLPSFYAMALAMKVWDQRLRRARRAKHWKTIRDSRIVEAGERLKDESTRFLRAMTISYHTLLGELVNHLDRRTPRARNTERDDRIVKYYYEQKKTAGQLALEFEMTESAVRQVLKRRANARKPSKNETE